MNWSTEDGVHSLGLTKSRNGKLDELKHQNNDDEYHYQKVGMNDANRHHDSYSSEETKGGEHGDSWHDKVENCNVFGEPGEDSTQWVRVKEQDFGTDYLECHLLMHSCGTHGVHKENNDSSCKGDEHVRNDQNTEVNWVFILLLLFLFLFGPQSDPVCGKELEES